MSTITRRPGVQRTAWRAAVKVGNQRATKTFTTRADAVKWAGDKETELRGIRANLSTAARPHGNTAPAQSGALASRTLGDLLQRYSLEESPKKEGSKWEVIRINLLLKDPVSAVPLSQLTAADLADWRDRRGGFKPSHRKPVKPGSVRRELVILSSALNTAVREWGWIVANPIAGIKWPETPESRDRRITSDEFARIRHTCGYSEKELPGTVRACAYAAFLFAVETAMRQGEIARLKWVDVDFKTKVAKVRKGKSRAARRDVPLSTEAVRILEQMKPLKSMAPTIFQISADQMSNNFAAAVEDAVVEDLTFHDSRHEAITRLAQKIEVLALARLVGHRDLKQLMVYYNETAEHLATKLGEEIE
jgi:integrase